MSELVLEKNKELPNGWKESNLDLLSIFVTKGSTPTTHGFEYQKTGINFIKVENIVNGWIDQKTIREFINQDTNNYLKRSQLKENDILFSIAGTIGRTTIIRQIDLPANTNQAIAIIRCSWKYLNPKYIRLILDSPILFNLFNAKTRGVGIYNLSLSDIKELTIPLPPLNEQKRIVEKIDKIFTIISNIEKLLTTSIDLINSYNVSLLQQIFLKSSPILSNWGVTFEHWNHSKISDIGEVITGGTPDTAKLEYYGDNYCFFKPTDLNKGFNVNNSKSKLSEEGIKNARFIPKNSILVTCIGATIGKTGISRIDGATNQQINSILPYEDTIIPEFLYYVCISNEFQQLLKKNSSSTTMPIINKSKFSKLVIPVPSINDQKIISHYLEIQYSITNQILIKIKSYLLNLKSLKNVILKQAFEGKLVPQDPNDEPAEILLQKIKQEKEQLIQKQKASRSTKNVK